MSFLLDSKTPSHWDDDSGDESAQTRDGTPSEQVEEASVGDELQSAETPNSEAASDAPVPRKIGRYQITKQLGQGGFGFVYLAIDPELHRRVAIKVPRWDRPLTRNGIDRFLNEGKLLAQIEHPSIVSVHDLGMTEDEIPYVVMQYVEGRTLRRILKSRKLELGQGLRLLMQIAIALREAHKETIVHRDFKPSNLIIDEKGGIHLVDFGMALHDDLTLNDFKTKSPAGTPQFMAPEQVRGENHRIDGRTDIWAFGVTMYLMMTGRLPFRGDDRQRLTRAICYQNPKPLRQLNDAVTRELERICLRCLSKLMDDRYQSMADVIDELQAARKEFEAARTDGESVDYSIDTRSQSPGWAGTSTMGKLVSGSPSITGSAGSISSGEPLHIVPKGLRSFDENDHDFFVQLLPGPTDRLGLPESIRFWSSRLGKDFQVEDVPIGIIYGPSGCGKSSFVRAGLIPRIATDVIPVYVDCTTTDVCQNIVDRISRELDGICVGDDLVSTIRNLRQKAGEEVTRKVVLILDQFEQWLESADEDSRREMTEALRQCDARHIQCLILVRDDYWMSISEFMRCLERPLVEGKNAMSLPLFDRRHAKRVLVACGRSVGALPSAITPMTKSERRFVNDAVESIAENGTVLCVRLTILADMIADADWGKTSFNRTFGFDGIGTAFLERHLTDNVRVHKSGWLPACEVILANLLPPTTQTELKATERKRTELLELAGLERKTKGFDDCLGYLQNDLKLISAVESDNAVEPEEGDIGFRLTHDFFVIPIRQWLLRRQSKTLAGRIRNRFSELCTQYQIAGNKRYLPGPVEYLLTLLFVRRRNLGEPAREFLRKAHRHHFIRFISVAVLLASAALVTHQVWRSQEARYNFARLFIAGPDEAIRLIDEEMKENPWSYLDRAEGESDSEDPMVTIRARTLVSVIENSSPDRLGELLDMVDSATVDDYPFFEYAVRQYSGSTANELERAFDAAQGDLFARARIVILQLSLGNAELLKKFVHNAIPDHRTCFTDVFTRWHGDIPTICAAIGNAESNDVVFAAIEALAFDEISDRARNSDANKAVNSLIETLYEETDDKGVFKMLEFCAPRWNLDLPEAGDREFLSLPIHGMDSRYNRLLLIGKGVLNVSEGREALHLTEVGKSRMIPSFYVSPTEVSLGMYRQYFEWLKTSGNPGDIERRNRLEKMNLWSHPDSSELPISSLYPCDIFEFLNWLSRKNGLDEAYKKAETGGESDLDAVYEWQPASNGFRTPTTFEVEWIIRSGASGCQYSFGGGEDGLDFQTLRDLAFRYGTVEGSEFSAITSNAPNRYGIFESQGNAQDFCHDYRMQKFAGPMRHSIMPGSFRLFISAIYPGDVLPRSRSDSPSSLLGFRIAQNASRN